MLTKSQIRYLKSCAHSLSNSVIIGANGLTMAVHKEIDRELSSHELIKIKLPAIENEEQRELIKEISQYEQAEFINQIGHIAIFYRKNNNPEFKTKSKYILPKD